MQTIHTHTITFMGLYSSEIRVKFSDHVWSVFDGLFCHVALPLPEAKLKNRNGCNTQFYWRRKRILTHLVVVGLSVGLHLIVGSDGRGFVPAFISTSRWSGLHRRPLSSYTHPTHWEQLLKKAFGILHDFTPAKTQLLALTWVLSLTSVDSEEAFWGEVVVVVARNVWRGGLQYAHLWMVGANAEPVRLRVSALMVEIGISTVLWEVTKKGGRTHILIYFLGWSRWLSTGNVCN